MDNHGAFRFSYRPKRGESVSGGSCPTVAMMETADARLRFDLACSVQGVLDRAIGRCGLLQRDMSSVLVIVRKIFTPQASEMVFVQRDDVISPLPASTADPAFGDSVLPRAAYTGLIGLMPLVFRKAATSLPNLASRSNRT